ncbi:MAG TPA: Lrp/AsnC family transcriptional regulator, partial [Thermoplasmata archaeon]|nr:Lrp/AsnC family transcriptional regulator [Thermoplasmata archaeon]
MDPTDLALCKLLLEDSRRPYRELADRLGLSVAAVHGRIQALREGGIIRAFTARIGHPALGSTNLLVWGPSAPAAREGLVDRLGADEHVYWVALAGAGVLYVGAYLRSIAELDGCVSFIVQEAG